MPFLFTGIIIRVKALWSGRQGPPILQPWYDWLKLMKKGEVASTAVSLVFKVSPAIVAAASISAVLVVPLIDGKSFISFPGDFIFFVSAFAVGKYFSILSALDTGSSFEGIGASRDAVYTALVEPALMLFFFSCLIFTKNLTLGSMITSISTVKSCGMAGTVLAAIVLFIMMLIEGCRVPADDPATHLELTMIHEAMLLDNSGPNLAMMVYAASLKTMLFGILIAKVITGNIRGVSGFAYFIIIICLSAAAIGIIESLSSRFKMSHLPEFSFFMLTLSVVLCACALLFVFGGI